MIWYWYSWIQSPAVSKRQEVRWCSIRRSFSLSVGYFWESIIDMVIPTPSCSYCIWNRYCQNHRRILPNFQLFVWLHMVEFNRLPCQNDKMYDGVVFADRFRYQLTMFEVFEIDMAISTPIYSYCISNSYIKNHHWELAWCGKRSRMQYCSEMID